MGSINSTARQNTGAITTTAAATLDFEFPVSAGTKNKAVMDGAICICFTPQKGAGADLTELNVSAVPLHRNPAGTLVAGLPAVLQVSDLTFVDDQLYSYPVENTVGPCDGIRLSFVYDNADVGVEEIDDIEAFLSYT